MGGRNNAEPSVASGLEVYVCNGICNGETRMDELLEVDVVDTVVGCLVCAGDSEGSLGEGKGGRKVSKEEGEGGGGGGFDASVSQSVSQAVTGWGSVE